MNETKTNDICTTVTYGPAGSDNTLQRTISKFLISLFTLETDMTPGQLGYLGCMPVSVGNKAMVKLFFVPKYSGTLTRDYVTFSDKIVPHPAFKCLENWFHVGDINNIATVEYRVIKKYRMVKVEVDGKEYRVIDFIKEDKKDDSDNPRYKLVDNCPVMAIRCNLDLVMAAINDVDLSDPSFKVNFKHVAKRPKASEHVIVSSTPNMEFPIHITVSYDGNGQYRGYDPSKAIPYLMKKRNEVAQVHEVEKELQKNAGKRAKKARNEAKKASGMDYMRKYGK